MVKTSVNMSVDTKSHRTSCIEIYTNPEHLNYIKLDVTGTVNEVLETLEECETLLRENQNLHKTKCIFNEVVDENGKPDLVEKKLRPCLRKAYLKVNKVRNERKEIKLHLNTLGTYTDVKTTLRGVSDILQNKSKKLSEIRNTELENNVDEVDLDLKAFMNWSLILLFVFSSAIICRLALFLTDPESWTL